MQDCWLPRLYVIAQVVVLVVCGALIGIGKDSVITDLFCAGAGGLLLTEGYRRVSAKIAQKTDQDQGGV